MGFQRYRYHSTYDNHLWCIRLSPDQLKSCLHHRNDDKWICNENCKFCQYFTAGLFVCLCFCVVLLAFYLHGNRFPRRQRSLRSHAERTLHSQNIQALSSAAHIRVMRGNFVWPHYGTLQMSYPPYLNPRMRRSALSTLKTRRTILSGEICSLWVLIKATMLCAHLWK